MSSILKKEIPKLLDKNFDLKVLEIGAGSGVNLRVLSDLGVKKENIYSCDIAPDAVNHCRDLGFNCIKSDLFEKITKKFDVIIFNPPYLPEDKAEPEDSKVATTGGEKGGEVINRFLRQARNHLVINGRIFLITSSLTKGINWLDYEKSILARKKLFFEELYVWRLK